MSSNDYFGWDLLHKTIEKDIKSEADILIGVLHWYLIRKLSFLCVGIGDDKTLGEDENGSEILPENWNINKEHYSLRYVNNKKLYILKGVKNDDDIILNFLEPQSRVVSNVTINLKDTVKSLNGNLTKIIPDVNDLLKRFDDELFEPVLSGRAKEQNTQTTNVEYVRPSIGFQSPPPIFIPTSPGNPQFDDPLRNVGRGDLDPFGRGGGMLFPGPDNDPWQIQPPLHPGLRNPPPPGARFDPLGPDMNPFGGRNNGRRNNREPNPDHFAPPPDYNDMFM